MVQLSCIDKATNEDCLYGIDQWAALFKAKTWKELRDVAGTNRYMESAVKTIFELSTDENIREQCRAREEFESYQRYLNKRISDLEQLNADKDAKIADKDAEITRLRELLDAKNKD